MAAEPQRNGEISVRIYLHCNDLYKARAYSQVHQVVRLLINVVNARSYAPGVYPPVFSIFPCAFLRNFVLQPDTSCVPMYVNYRIPAAVLWICIHTCACTRKRSTRPRSMHRLATITRARCRVSPLNTAFCKSFSSRALRKSISLNEACNRFMQR